jgi:hypothetical protein
MEEIEQVEKTSVISHLSVDRRVIGHSRKTHTVKKSSPGPNTMLGLITVASGEMSKTDFSASALVLAYGMLLFSSAPIALKWIIFAPTFFAAFATFSAPFHWISSKSLGVPVTD